MASSSDTRRRLPGAAAVVADGWRRVVRAPWLVVGAWTAMWLASLPLGLVLHTELEASFGASLEAARATRGVPWHWWAEFMEQAQGLGTTFTPNILGFAAVLTNLSDFVDNAALPAVLAGWLAVWLVLWAFLSGGFLDRLARQRPTYATGFFGACGLHFGRMLRLGVLAWMLYAVLFALLHPALFEKLQPWATRDLASERTAFLLYAVLMAAFLLLLVAVNVLIDYARIRLVVEDRRSAFGALVAASRFILRHPGPVVAVYALNAAIFLLVVLVYALAAPRAHWPVWAALFIGQLYLVARLEVKLAFYASQTALFQSRLAHAEYTAAPALEWPESPAAEALDPPSRVS
jgi:hypothetical protein